MVKTQRLDRTPTFSRIDSLALEDEQPIQNQTTQQPKLALVENTPAITDNGSMSSKLSRRNDLDLRASFMQQRVNNLALTNPLPNDIVTVSKKRFKDWDTDKNGYLSKAELDAAMLDANNKGDDAAAVATLKDRREVLQKLSNDEYGAENDGITERDLDAYEATRKLTPKSDDIAFTEGRYQNSQNKIKDASRDLFPDGTPKMDAIKQGGLGDCSFLAALGSKTNLDPESIKKMVKENEDGTYTVEFPGEKPVIVTKPTDAEIGLYGGAGKNGLWAAVLEKGWGQVKSKNNWLWNEKLPQDELANGETAQSGIDALTAGKTTADDLKKTSQNVTRDKLDAAFRDKKIVTAAIFGKTNKKEDKNTALPTKHGYSVIGWDRATDTVTLRNPWGNRELQDANGKALDGTDDGVFTMKLADFYKTFNEIAYEK
jgi:hypothetical protein